MIKIFWHSYPDFQLSFVNRIFGCRLTSLEERILVLKSNTKNYKTNTYLPGGYALFHNPASSPSLECLRRSLHYLQCSGEIFLLGKILLVALMESSC